MPRVVSQYAMVEVWRSLEVLAKAVETGAADCAVFDEYREDALHEFPRRDLEKTLNTLGCKTRGT